MSFSWLILASSFLRAPTADDSYLFTESRASRALSTTLFDFSGQKIRVKISSEVTFLVKQAQSGRYFLDFSKN
jgi:hypothetical protein